MTGEPRLRRRGRGAGLRGLLVDRDRELAAIEQALADARDGLGTVLFVEAPAGKGKSRLLNIAGDLARDAGMQVFGAYGNELERDYPFGVAVQLFEPRWSGAEPAERARLLEGPARHAGELLNGGLPGIEQAPDDHGYSVVHGLFWLCTNLVFSSPDHAEIEPLVLLVDDAHWSDRPSLRFLAYVAERIEELPIAVLVTVRSGEEATDRQALAALRRSARGRVLRPGSLSADGVRLLVASVFENPDAEFCRACARVTNCNPFLLTELLEQLARNGESPTAATAARLGDMAPESVLEAVVERLDALSRDARTVARAVSVLGSGAHLRRVAELTGLDTQHVIQAADALAAVHLFHPGSPLGFVHPLIANGVVASLSPLDRGSLHRRAAEVLAAEGAPEEQIASHLLLAPPEADPRAVEILRVAARRALASGAAHSGVRMLQRALAEAAGAPPNPELLAELAQAETAAGLPHAAERLEHALTVADDAALRARLALIRARALYEDCKYREASHVLADGLTDIDCDDEVVEQLQEAFIATAFFVPELTSEGQRRAQLLLQEIGDRPRPTQLDLLAHMAVHGALRGETRADVTRMAEKAWADGALLQAEGLDRLSWPLLTAALLYAGDVEFSIEICNAALAAARDSNNPSFYAAATYCRAWPLYEQGRIVDAAADAQAGLDAQPDGWRVYLRSAYAVIALCHIQRGQLEQAETALSIIGHPDVRERVHLPSLLDARAQLRLAEHRPVEALEDALQAGRELEATIGVSFPGSVAWRSTAALAKLALGDDPGAKELAAAELQQALRIGMPRLLSRNLRILGLAESGTAGLDLLAEAVARGNAAPRRLEHIAALIDYGAALRRANRRSAARAPLRRALDLATRGGATALAHRAQVELAAAGARPRRIALTGIESLTPSERRVADMAATGLTTRQVAEALFVTPKTVEFHLRHIYRKLEIKSRDQLAELLGEQAGASG